MGRGGEVGSGHHGRRRRVALATALLMAVLLAACAGPGAQEAAELPPPGIPTVATTAPGARAADATADGEVAGGAVSGADGAATADPAVVDPADAGPAGAGTTAAVPAVDVDIAGAAAAAAGPPPPPPGVVRPDWLGTRPLQLDADGQALPAPTPDELVVRRVPTLDLLPAPPHDAPFTATVAPLDDALVARSTWTPACPVDRSDLRLLIVSFWGFDDRPHTGEIIVHHTFAEEVVDIFGQLFDARYPIEEMRIVSAAELEGTPTGDGNDTTGFVCRPVRGSTRWSQHAYGLAIDINPFHNPYQRGERILPELAGAYLDRTHDRPGMLSEGSTAVTAFDAIGWGWGGRWTSLIDWMHFSADGR